MQLNEPMLFVHSASAWQLWLKFEHSLISKQSVPDPVKPALQAHAKVPMVLEQDAFNAITNV